MKYGVVGNRIGWTKEKVLITLLVLSSVLIAGCFRDTDKTYIYSDELKEVIAINDEIFSILIGNTTISKIERNVFHDSFVDYDVYEKIKEYENTEVVMTLMNGYTDFGYYAVYSIEYLEL